MHFPKEEELDFDNFIVGVSCTPDENYFNVHLESGASSKFDFKGKHCVTKRFDGTKVRKIYLGYYSNHVLRGIKMLDSNQNVLYETQRDYESAHT